MSLRFTWAVPAAVKSPVEMLIDALKPLIDAVNSVSFGSNFTEVADTLTDAVVKDQLPPDWVAFNSDTVTLSDVNSSNL